MQTAWNAQLASLVLIATLGTAAAQVCNMGRWSEKPAVAPGNGHVQGMSAIAPHTIMASTTS
jgi:hypothetical protein